MPKITSVADLRKIKESAKEQFAARSGGARLEGSPSGGSGTSKAGGIGTPK